MFPNMADYEALIATMSAAELRALREAIRNALRVKLAERGPTSAEPAEIVRKIARLKRGGLKH